jgi:glycosyltransferase involved in cell wall biosynthesis
VAVCAPLGRFRLSSELTIVIPAKNEAKMLPKLLNSLAKQDYDGIAEIRVIVADEFSRSAGG